MNTIYQDLTLTLDITSMSREEYQRINNVLKALSNVGDVTTFTYTEDSDQKFDDDQNEQINSLI